MNQQPGMRPQFPSPQLSKPQTVSTMGAQGNLQQVPLTQVSQTPLSQQQPVFYDRSGLTQQELLTQHLRDRQQLQLHAQQQQWMRLLQQQQQQQQEHQPQTQSPMTHEGLSAAMCALSMGTGQGETMKRQSLF